MRLRIARACRKLAFIALLPGCLSAPGQPATSRTTCEDLARLKLPEATITLARLVAPGAFVMPPEAASAGPRASASAVDARTLPEFCRVAATLRPTPESSIRIEVWLPAAWNGNFLGLGNGGMAGSIVYAGGMALGLTDAVRLGYATANTDVGHDSSQEKTDGEFLLHHPERQIDFGYRATHLMTLAAKQLILAFYGKPSRRSIFIGCSLGSQEAMSEVKRYPDDYNGVIAGAPMNALVEFNSAQLWPSVLIARDPAKAITRANIAAVHQAVLATCGTELDRRQGSLENPETCHFDPRTLLCKNGESRDDCLTSPQAELVRQIYQGPIDPRTGKVLFIGPPPGAEGQMGMVTGPTPHSSSLAVYRYAVMSDPGWDWKTMDFSRDVDRAVSTAGRFMDTDAHLNPFFDHGGKLLLYVGWEDYHNPIDTIGYYKQILGNAGPGRAQSIRLFTIPGMGHCFGGDGCGAFDKVGAMESWLSTGRAPDVLPSQKLQSGKVVMTRPLCAYPRVAQYNGSGDVTQSENFTCEVSAALEAIP